MAKCYDVPLHQDVRPKDGYLQTARVIGIKCENKFVTTLAVNPSRGNVPQTTFTTLAEWGNPRIRASFWGVCMTRLIAR